MPFREKRAWAELASILAVYGVYVVLFGRTWTSPNESGVALATIGAVIATSVVLAIVLTVLTALAAASSPKEANGPYDERDRLIDLSASTAGFYALQTGAFIVLLDVMLHASLALIANSVLLTMAAGQAVRAAWQAISYRRSAA